MEGGKPLVSDEDLVQLCKPLFRPAKPAGAIDNLLHPNDLIEPSFDTGEAGGARRLIVNLPQL